MSRKTNENSYGGHYEVGYRKPPMEHRFHPGRTGNPNGRLKDKTIEDIDALRVVQESVSVRVSGRRKRMSRFEVGVRQLVNRALTKQNVTAAMRFIRLCERHKLVTRAASEQQGGVLVLSQEEWEVREAEQVKYRESLLKILREDGKI